MKKKCPKCDEEFECTEDDNCWCNKIDIPKAKRKMISRKYDDCLCEECLKSYVSLDAPTAGSAQT